MSMYRSMHGSIYGQTIKHRSLPIPFITKEEEVETFIKNIEGISKIITSRTVSKHLTIEKAQQYANEDYITYEAAPFRPMLIEKREEFEKKYPLEYAVYVRNGSLDFPNGNEIERAFYRSHLLKVRKEFEERNPKIESEIKSITEIKSTTETKTKKRTTSKKKSIPSTVKRLVWNKHIGEEIGKHKCLCCNSTDISQMSFHCGHIVAEANGGKSIVSNLKPICQNCNSSMGTKNMNEFMETLQ